MSAARARVVLLFFLGANVALSFAKYEWKHHNNEELVEVLNDVHQRCPNVTRIYNLSEPSVRGVPIKIIEFSSHPGHHVPLTPEFKYIANMHGNEVLGRELLLKLADHLCEGFLAGDSLIRQLLRSTRIHLLPSMNPDGWQTATEDGGTDYIIGRSNNHSVDLNRNFPDLNRIMYTNEDSGRGHNNHLLPELDQLSQPIEAETRAVMRLIMQVPFVLSANIHGGELVANYPYDESKTGASSEEYSLSPDDDTFRELALVYASHHADMASPERTGCSGSDSYNFGKQGGITNGAQWYSLKGGMQDFNYLSSNDFEITLELGCDKYPPASQLEHEWIRNKDALLAYMWAVHTGIKGMIREPSGRGIAGAVIRVRNVTDPWRHNDIRHDVTSVHDGDYFRLLTPGYYDVSVSKNGFIPETRRVRVKNLPYSAAARLDFTLRPLQYEKPSHKEYDGLAQNSIGIRERLWLNSRKKQMEEDNI